ncbi:MAG: YbjN domain-containing protein [Acidimicrobiales bacterium]
MPLSRDASSTVPVAPIATDDEVAACCRVIDRWSAARLTDGAAIVAVDRQPDAMRWYLRMTGEDKDFVTVWLTIRQRTLYHEAQVMPAPETNIAQTYEYLLRRNAELSQMRFALGAEDAVYIVGDVPVGQVDEEELDRIVGGSLAYVDAVWVTAMTIGYAGMFRPRRTAGPRAS